MLKIIFSFLLLFFGMSFLQEAQNILQAPHQTKENSMFVLVVQEITHKWHLSWPITFWVFSNSSLSYRIHKVNEGKFWPVRKYICKVNPRGLNSLFYASHTISIRNKSTYIYIILVSFYVYVSLHGGVFVFAPRSCHGSPSSEKMSRTFKEQRAT